ncbi:NADPH-dependent curcumin reductase [Shimia sp. SK013]|uniref:NADP-dependent oxidoreductase n=1 Tax=Shimia sp. SK013 TaxID=1389006 RepID=UPI0006B50BC5|nr:NADP-dependent oxidoreductase [Shimia sp. SK013]KPA23134.1 NADPH-dependent curcumin reductase [Shimia sp. SK013]
MSEQMQRIVLASRPVGEPTDENFTLETLDIPEIGDGEVLVRNHYMSLDPYMRGRMDDAKSYAAPVPIGGTMEGGTVGEVIASKHPGFAPGDFVFGMLGWATHGVGKGAEMRKLDPKLAPITTALGVLGMPGFTGWFGLMEYGKPKEGETLVVAAATGPVGSMVGQVAKARGLRVVGIAGGPEKCKMAVETLGFDACIDHYAFETASDLRRALKAECPKGIDIYFENVGGKILDAVLPMMNPHGRIPLCGMIAWYNAGALGAEASAEALTGPRMWRSILVNFLSVNGFIISNHFDSYPDFLRDVGPMLAQGKLAFVEDIADGLENAPEAFRGLLNGRNKGKQLVKLI